MDRHVSIERYANVPYEEAAAGLRAQGPDVVLDDPVAGTIALDADVAGFLVSRPVTPRIDLTRELDPHAVVLPLAWQAADHPRRFPTFEGLLEVSALSHHPPQVQLALLGTVRPPLGVVGAIGDAVAGRELGDGALRDLLDRIADRLVAVVAERASTRHHAISS